MYFSQATSNGNAQQHSVTISPLRVHIRVQTSLAITLHTSTVRHSNE